MSFNVELTKGSCDPLTVLCNSEKMRRVTERYIEKKLLTYDWNRDHATYLNKNGETTSDDGNIFVAFYPVGMVSFENTIRIERGCWYHGDGREI